MITLNPGIEKLIKSTSLDSDCDSLSDAIFPICDSIEETIDVDMYDTAVPYFLQLLKSISFHFIENEHCCYFDDMYSPDYMLQHTYEKFIKANKAGRMNERTYVQLIDGMKEIATMEAFRNYGYLVVCSMI